MTAAPPAHLSPGAAAYLRDPDVLAYPSDWTDPWDVHSVREIAHPLWSSINETLDFHYEVIEERIGGVPCERIRALEAPRADVVVLHFHGGMYCLGIPEIDRVLNAPVSLGTGLDVLSVDYRLAPEHPFPAAVDDAVAVWRSLADQGIDVIAMGESAGGGRLRDDGPALQAAIRATTSQNQPLLLPAGTYRTNTQLNVPFGNPLRLVGVGWDQSKIVAGATMRAVINVTCLSGPGVAPEGGAATPRPLEGLYIGDVTLDANSTANYSVFAPGLARSRFERVAVDHAQRLFAAWYDEPSPSRLH